MGRKPSSRQRLTLGSSNTLLRFFGRSQRLGLTGARSGEISVLQAEDLDLAQGVAVLNDHKTAHLGKSRVIFHP